MFGLFTSLYLWFPVFEKHIYLLWLFRDAACSQSYALMYCILTVASKLKWIGLQRIVGSEYMFRWMGMRERSVITASEPWEAKWYSVAEPIWQYKCRITEWLELGHYFINKKKISLKLLVFIEQRKWCKVKTRVNAGFQHNSHTDSLTLWP